MFSALILSEDGQIFHDDVFKIHKHLQPIACHQVNFNTIKENPVLALMSERAAQDELMESNHLEAMCALSSLIILKPLLEGNPEFETALKHVSRITKNNEIYWGVTPKDEVQNGNSMPDTDL